MSAKFGRIIVVIEIQLLLSLNFKSISYMGRVNHYIHAYKARFMYEDVILAKWVSIRDGNER